MMLPIVPRGGPAQPQRRAVYSSPRGGSLRATPNTRQSCLDILCPVIGAGLSPLVTVVSPILLRFV